MRNELTTSFFDPANAIHELTSSDSPIRQLLEELITGKSAVAQTFQEAGRSYVVLAPADTGGRRPLTARELAATRLMAAGLTDKEIGAQLGIAVSSVATHRGRAQRKLGISSRGMLAQLIHLLEAHAEPQEAARTLAPSSNAVTLRMPDWSERMPMRLTRAERDVARLLLEGLSNAEISARRGTSERTVANQVAYIGRKTGVSGRRALAAALIQECLVGHRHAENN
jgi:DNA-binding CsgD family transcriptional regulator